MKEERPTLPVRLILADRDADVRSAWELRFAPCEYVEIRDADPLETEVDALVVPGNAFGFLDSGFELRASERFGLEFQDQLRARVRSEFAGEMLVGQALVERYGGRALIYAPLWRTPQSIASTVNAALCARGAVRALAADQAAGQPAVETLAIPALGVGAPGNLHPAISARQLRYGFEVGAGYRGGGGKNLTRQIRREIRLKSMPRTAADTDAGDDGTLPAGS